MCSEWKFTQAESVSSVLFLKNHNLPMPYALIVIRLERFMRFKRHLMRRERVLSAREWTEYRILSGTPFHFFKLCPLSFLCVLLFVCEEEEDLCDGESLDSHAWRTRAYGTVLAARVAFNMKNVSVDFWVLISN